MRKIALLLTSIILLGSCVNKTGTVLGGKNSGFTETPPPGMAFIKKGTFLMGVVNESKMFRNPDIVNPVTVQSFWMDEHEVTNSQYREFVDWVRDSVAYRALIMAGRDEYILRKRGMEDEDESPETARINWKMKVPWSSKDEEIQDILSFMYYQDKDVLDGKIQLNPSKFIYRYQEFNYDQAVMEKNKYDLRTDSYNSNATVTVDTSYFDENGKVVRRSITRKLRSRSDLISVIMLNIYPDTVTWSSDFKFANNVPKMEMYFSHPGYSNYPVVGVNWEQAKAYCNWRTMRSSNGRVKTQGFRLPTEAEWEYAARGGMVSSTYPWKGEHVRDEMGCYLANFKQSPGNYLADNSSTTVTVGSYPSNRFGLFDMAGNVAEWTSTAYNQLSGTVTSDINPNFEYHAKVDDPASLKRKVVKGGSWKDIPYYLQCGARDYEYQGESRPYIGFRCVRSFNGEN